VALFPIHSLDDPRVLVYRNLKDKELDRAGELFIAEGSYIVRRLLESDFAVVSVLAAENRLPQIQDCLPDDVPLYVAGQEVFRGILGMKFQSGVMACGRRKPWRAMEQVIPKKDRLTLVVLPDIANAQNVGSLVRIGAAFGVDAVLLGEQCHDPFWRQAIRVSMGTVFKLPLYQSRDLLADLRQLKSEWGVELAASVLHDDAQPLEQAQRSLRLAILFGNEAQGLPQEYTSACDRRVTIPMKLGTDSLNVAVAAGIFLYHFTLTASCDRDTICARRG
jgi:tRNA G18 (ribose-2'-O)-methylase SpoU